MLTQFSIEENRFGVEPEMTAKVAKLGCRIYEVGVSYYGRTWCIVTLKYSVKIWLCQSQLKEEAMAIRYAVDLTDTERAA